MRTLERVHVLLFFVAVSGAMKLVLRIPALIEHLSQKQGRHAFINDDGCGIINGDGDDGVLANKPRYSAYNSVDSDAYEKVLKCLNEMHDSYASSPESYVDPANFTMMRCSHVDSERRHHHRRICPLHYPTRICHGNHACIYCEPFALGNRTHLLHGKDEQYHFNET